jgi:hypothetical protein
MARIVNVEARGLRGRDFSYELEQLVLITGAVGSGKTSVADAVRFAALGFIPEIGKTNAATGLLMSGREMSVGLTLQAGPGEERTSVQRSLSHFRGSLKGNSSVSWLNQKAPMTEHGEEIVGTFGADQREVEENLDLRSLLNASPNQRAKRLEQILDASGASPEQIREWMKALALARMSGREADDVWDAGDLALAVRAWSDTLDGALVNAVEMVIAALRDHLAESLGNALERVSLDRADLQQSLAKRGAARAELEDRIAGLGIPTETLADLRVRRQTLTDEAAALRERSRAQQELAGQLEEAKAAVEAAELEAARLQALEDDIRTSRSRLMELEQLEPDAPAPFDAPAFAPSERLAAQIALVRSMKASAPDQPTAPPAPVLIDLGPLERDLADGRAALEEAKANPWVVAWGLAQQVESGSEAMTNLIGHIEANLPDAERLQAAFAHRQQSLEDAKGRNEQIAAEHEEASRLFRGSVVRYEAGLEDVKQAEEALVALRQSETERYNSDLERRSAAHNEALEARTGWETAIGEVRVALNAQLKDQEKVTAAVAHARQRYSDLAGRNPFDIQAAIDRVTAIDQELVDVDSQIEQLGRADARRSEMETITREIQQAEADLEATRAVEWALQRIRERDLGARGEPILSRMRTFLKAAGRSEVPYFKAENRQVDFGWVRGDRPIHVSSMSGGETALYVTALAAAIIALRAPACRVLLVEAAEAGPIMGALLRGIEAVSGELDNAIVTTWVPVQDGATIKGWQHIDLTPAAVTA